MEEVTVNKEQLENIANIFIEGWNLKSAWERSGIYHEADRRRRQNQIERFNQRAGLLLKKFHMTFLDFTGQPYAVELPVQVINAEDCQNMSHLYIQIMKQPVIKMVDTEEIIHMGIVVLGKQEG